MSDDSGAGLHPTKQQGQQAKQIRERQLGS